MESGALSGWLHGDPSQRGPLGAISVEIFIVEVVELSPTHCLIS